jgi:hypothetical protein
LSNEFVRIVLLVVGASVVVYLLIAALVFTGNRRQSKRYRPGRPFDFTPVWFLSSPQQHARAGLVPARELTAGAGAPTRRPSQTGGASDTW